MRLESLNVYPVPWSKPRLRGGMPSSQPGRFWVLPPPPGTCMGSLQHDDELYISGCTVVWSAGFVVRKSFIMSSPVLQALWCSFPPSSDEVDGNDNIERHEDHDNVNHEWCFDSDVASDSESSIGNTFGSIASMTSLSASLCIVETGRMTFFHPDGQVHAVPLPLAVARVMPLPHGGHGGGLVFQLGLEPSALFALSHSLAELRPVLCVGIDENVEEAEARFDEARSEQPTKPQQAPSLLAAAATAAAAAAGDMVLVYSSKRHLVAYSPSRRSHSVWVAGRAREEVSTSPSHGLVVEPSGMLPPDWDTKANDAMSVESIAGSEAMIVDVANDNTDFIGTGAALEPVVVLKCMWSEKDGDSLEEASAVFSVHSYNRRGQRLCLLKHDGVLLVVTLGDSSTENIVAIDVAAAVPMCATTDEPRDVLILRRSGDLALFINCDFTHSAAVEVPGGVVGLLHPVLNRVSLLMSDGSHVRATLPLAPTSSLVRLCLNALNASGVAQSCCRDFWDGVQVARSVEGGEWSFLERLLSTSLGISIHSKTVDNECPFSKMLVMCSQFDTPYLPQINLSSTNNMTKVSGCTSTCVEASRILLALHAVYEECHLSLLHTPHRAPLAELLCPLAASLGMEAWCDRYERNHGLKRHSTIASSNSVNNMLPLTPPDVFLSLAAQARGSMQIRMPLAGPLTSMILRLFYIYYGQPTDTLRGRSTVRSAVTPMTSSSPKRAPISAPKRWATTPSPTFMPPLKRPCHRRHFFPATSTCPAQRVVLALVMCDFSIEKLDDLPGAVALPFREAIALCREHPPSDWPVEAYILLDRADLAAAAAGGDIPVALSPDSDAVSRRLRFPLDMRVHEVTRLLCSSDSRCLTVIHRPEMSDHDILTEQQVVLLAAAQRTMALSLGRGMFELDSVVPVATAPLSISPLVLSGRFPPHNAVVTLDSSALGSLEWPEFHSGVAAGLSVASEVSSTWIVYNRPLDGHLSHVHAGFLMGMGMRGRLASLTTMNVYEYLAQGHETTSVGLLLGLAAGQRGSMATAVAKMLCIHVPELLPPSSAELDIPPMVQSAALLGVGLLYLGSAQRRMTEVLLTEISRRPGPGVEHTVDRESHSLAAGLGLGLVILKTQGQAVGLADLFIEDQLSRLIDGGRRLDEVSHDSMEPHSYKVIEGSGYNVDVTAPGAILAMALMYLQSNNEAIAARLELPQTLFLLDYVRADLLCLRVLARGMIMWDSVEATNAWVNAQIPAVIQTDLLVPDRKANVMPQEAHIISGACLTLGIRFAGSASSTAKAVLLDKCELYLERLIKAPAWFRSTLETCLAATALALSCVMAGSGDVDCLRLFRCLRQQPRGTYGFHMAIHQAIGFLFLGGALWSLGTNAEAVAGLIISLYPRFSTSACDNRYHLQAFRHLWVLAAEERALIARDIDTGAVCRVPVCGVGMTPCIIPETQFLDSVIVKDDERFWPIELDLRTQLAHLDLVTKKHTIYVKLRQSNKSDDSKKQLRDNLLRPSTDVQNISLFLTLSSVNDDTLADVRSVIERRYALNVNHLLSYYNGDELSSQVFEYLRHSMNFHYLPSYAELLAMKREGRIVSCLPILAAQFPYASIAGLRALIQVMKLIK